MVCNCNKIHVRLSLFVIFLIPFQLTVKVKLSNIVFDLWIGGYRHFQRCKVGQKATLNGKHPLLTDTSVDCKYICMCMYLSMCTKYVRREMCEIVIDISTMPNAKYFSSLPFCPNSGAKRLSMRGKTPAGHINCGRSCIDIGA